MLRPAQLYKDRLYEEYVKTWYKPEYMYYTGWTGDQVPEIPNNNYDTHHFVSIDKNDSIIGYINYSVDWISMKADRFGIISFDRGNIEFARDVLGIKDADSEEFNKETPNQVIHIMEEQKEIKKIKKCRNILQ